MHIDTLVQRLAAGGPAEQRSDGWLVRCPVHRDRHPSLLISVSPERKAILHCRSQGCDVAAMLKQVGLAWSDLFDVTGEITAGTAPSTELDTADIAALTAYLDRAQMAFAGSPAATYARQRFGITEDIARELRLGFDAGTTPFVHLSDSFREHPRLVVPFCTTDGIAHGAQGRDLSGTDPNRWAGLTNPEGKRWTHLAWFSRQAHGPVVVTEGPSDGLVVAATGFTAVAVAGASHARRRATAEAIVAGNAGREIVLAGDADESGQQFNTHLTEHLAEIGIRARWLSLPSGCGDLADWRQHSGDSFADEFGEAIRTARPKPLDGDFDDDPAELLEEVRTFLQRFLLIEPSAWFDVITLWIAATYFLRRTEAADVAPRLGFLSTVPGSGKTLALDLVCRLVQGRLAVDPTAASVLRTINALTHEDSDPGKPDVPVPLGLDEVDNLYAARGQDTSSITAVLNSGYKRGQDTIRADTNDQRKAISYTTFAPIVWAGLARAALPDALLSRTFVVSMQQAMPHERPASFRPRRDGPVADDLAAKLASWTASVADDDAVSTVLDQVEDELAPMVSNRDLELWSVLSLPAVMAGGQWPARAYAACEALRNAGKDQAENISVRFLRATRDVYRSGNWGRGINDRVVFRSALAERVIDADAIFARWGRGQGIDDEHVRRFLAEFGVRPVVVRVGKETGRGFRWADLMPPWNRYLGEDPDEPITE
ncbi:DUF3631 domain-containing protein [Saccharopolyspora aridisoli]|uniref:DUF3631 domain-containing protein n=1 Tax=Saccharopolyspora aridisoli TaxID=2530385 RepID=A0A4R4UZS3_9PSEU|nr:DUF3631 domain-containing protein [Saccharopolyspora aridisoli]TDC92339.1 DUF3631 domain-containing protein [Saccharopolyspora aridisoli]